MRPTRRLLFLCLLATIVWRTLPQIVQHCQTSWNRASLRRSTEYAVCRTAYPLDTSRWLEFDLPPHGSHLRLLTNAVLEGAAPPSTARRFPRGGSRYAIDFQLVDSEPPTGQPRRYHLRTRASHGVNEIGNLTRGTRSFHDVPMTLGETRTVQIPLASCKTRPGRIRIRLATCDRQVQEVVARVYVRQERPDYNQPGTWSRLSPDARQRLCRASVYPPELLTAREKHNLLRWDWTALVPRRSQAEPYGHRLIRLRDDADSSDVEFLPPPEGIACRPNLPVTIPTPEQPGIVHLSFFHDGKQSDAEQATAEVRVHGRREATTVQYRYPIDTLNGSPELETNGDLLEIVSNEHLICVASWRPVETSRPLTKSRTVTANVSASPTPRPRPSLQTAGPAVTLRSSAYSVRACLLEPVRPIRYAIAHDARRRTPLRVSLRALSTRAPHDSVAATTEPFEAREVEYEFLDRQNRIVHRGSLSIASQVARYDRASIGSVPMQVSEPGTYYFAVPSTVVHAQFRVKRGNVAIAAFTRPADLAHRFRIPGEQGVFGAPEETDRTWFLLLPDDYRARVAAKHCVDLEIQARRPGSHNFVKSGDGDWFAHRPRESTSGWYAITPRDESIPMRQEAAESTYHAVRIGATYRIKWRRDSADRPLEPRLIYLAPQHVTQPIQVWLDRKLHFEFLPRTRHGELRLPAIAEKGGTHELRLVGPANVRIYLRDIVAGNRREYAKRFVYRLTGEALTFDVVKQSHGAETFMLRTLVVRTRSDAATDSGGLSAGTSSSPTHRVQVRLVGIGPRPLGPQPGWTLEEQIFEFSADRAAMPSSFVLSHAGHAPECDQLCAVVLAEDLPPGIYRVQVRHLPPRQATALVSLYGRRPRAASPRDIDFSGSNESTARWFERREER